MLSLRGKLNFCERRFFARVIKQTTVTSPVAKKQEQEKKPYDKMPTRYEDSIETKQLMNRVEKTQEIDQLMTLS